jgi:2-polyprenyl-6-methoxyphenol hydroxylase-like FAD-dependent oxidoreductase
MISTPNPSAPNPAAATDPHRVPVAITGAGPVGLSAALALARAGIRSVIFERKTELDPHSRATLILPRTLEIFSQWNVLKQLVAQGNQVPHVRLREPHNGNQILHINFTKLAEQTAVMFTLAIPQDRVERILLDAAVSTGLVDVRFGTEMVKFVQGTDDVAVWVRSGTDESVVIADYLIGADGAHSNVRHHLGLELKGKTYPTHARLADVRVDPARDRTDQWPTILNHRGIVVGIRFGNRVWRIIEQAVDQSLSGPSLEAHITGLAQELFGPGPVDILWQSTYQKHERRAERFRVSRVTLVGDAAHLNSPAGGQGMNSGIQDAHNLAWKLASAITAPDVDADSLLESYSQERISLVTRTVQPVTDLAEHFQTVSPILRIAAVRMLDVIFGFTKSEGSLTSRFSMLDVAYHNSRLLRPGKTGVGRRVPNVIADDGQRIYPKMPNGGVLFAGDQARARDAAETLGLPLVNGDVAALTRFFDREQFIALIRPDHVVGAIDDYTDPTYRWDDFAAALGYHVTMPPQSHRVGRSVLAAAMHRKTSR